MLGATKKTHPQSIPALTKTQFLNWEIKGRKTVTKYPNSTAFWRQFLQQNSVSEQIFATMSTCMFGRINLNIQIEIGFYNENVALVCLAGFCCSLLVSCSLFLGKTAPQILYLKIKNIKKHQNNSFDKWIISVTSWDWSSHIPKFSIRFWKGKMSACNNTLRRAFGNVVNVLLTKCLQSTISIAISLFAC